MKFNKLSVALITVLICSFLLPGCGNKAEDIEKPVEIKVTFWGAPDEINIMRDIINEWLLTLDGPKLKAYLR